MHKLETRDATLHVSPQAVTVLLAVAGGIVGDGYRGEFLSIAETETLISQLQEAVADAKVERDRMASMTPGDKARLLAAVWRDFTDPAREG